MTVRCPKCKTELDAPEECVGQQVECPQCGHAFIVRKTPSRIAVPTQTALPKKRNKLEPHQKWMLIGLAVVLAVALPCVWFVGFLNRNADEIALKTWLRDLPTATTGLEPVPVSVSILISSDMNPADIDPKKAMLYPSIDGIRPSDSGFVPLHITQTFMLCDMTGVLATCREIPPEQQSQFAQRRDALAFLLRRNCAIGDTLPRGLYVYYGIYPIPFGNGVKQDMHLFVQTQDDFDAVVEGLKLEIKKRDIENEIEMQSKRAKSELVRKRRMAERDAIRPEMTSFLGISFGSIVPHGDSSFTKVKDEGDFVVYSFIPDEPLQHYTDYTVYAHKGNGRINRIEARINRKKLRSLNKSAEIESLRSYFRELYHGADESRNKDMLIFTMRGEVNLFLNKNTLVLTALDKSISDK